MSVMLAFQRELNFPYPIIIKTCKSEMMELNQEEKEITKHYFVFASDLFILFCFFKCFIVVLVIVLIGNS